MSENLASQKTGARDVLRTEAQIEESLLSASLRSHLRTRPLLLLLLFAAVDVLSRCLSYLSLSFSLFRTTRIAGKLVRARTRYFAYRCTCMFVDSWKLPRVMAKNSDSSFIERKSSVLQ